MKGNVDFDLNDNVDISDATRLSDFLFISNAPLICPDEADIDEFPGVDIGDLTRLIDYLFISFTPPVACQ